MKSKFNPGSSLDMAWQKGFKAGRHTRNILMIDEKLMWEHFANSDGDLKGNKITDLLDKTMLQVAINLFLDKSHQSEENGLVPLDVMKSLNKWYFHYKKEGTPMSYFVEEMGIKFGQEKEKLVELNQKQFEYLDGKCCTGHPNCIHNPHIPLTISSYEEGFKAGQENELVPLDKEKIKRLISKKMDEWATESSHIGLFVFHVDKIIAEICSKFGQPKEKPEVSPKIEGGYFGTHCHICHVLVKDCMCAKQREVIEVK